MDLNLTKHNNYYLTPTAASATKSVFGNFIRNCRAASPITMVLSLSEIILKKISKRLRKRIKLKWYFFTMLKHYITQLNNDY
jgi:hypothetical protein